MVYLGADISLSIWGLTRKVVSKDARKLWHYIEADYIKGYQAASKFSLALETAVDAFTLKNIYLEWRKEEKYD